MAVVPTIVLPPRITPTLIERPALLALIPKVALSRMTVVSAPAGSGKTTAMLFWAERLRAEGRPLLWLAARAGIGNKASFLLALKAAGVAARLDWADLDADASTRLVAALAAKHTCLPTRPDAPPRCLWGQGLCR